MKTQIIETSSKGKCTVANLEINIKTTVLNESPDICFAHDDFHPEYEDFYRSYKATATEILLLTRALKATKLKQQIFFVLLKVK